MFAGSFHFSHHKVDNESSVSSMQRRSDHSSLESFMDRASGLDTKIKLTLILVDASCIIINRCTEFSGNGGTMCPYLSYTPKIRGWRELTD